MRSKVVVSLLISFFIAGSVKSQSNELIIQGQTGKLYLTHTVRPKENWYSIGRLYNISPKEIAPFNNLTLDKGLSIGEQLEIPLTAVNFSQDGQKTEAESLVPLYHVVQDKEWLYRVSVNHNKVPISNLEKWNNISKDQVKTGMRLIVGYLKVKTALSALASGTGSGSYAYNSSGGTGGAAASVPASGSVPVAASTSTPVTTSNTGASNGDQGAADTKSVTAPAKTTGSTAIKFTAASDPKTNSVDADPEPSSTSASSNTSAVPNTYAAPNTSAAPVATVSKPVTPATPHPAVNFNGGYFKADFSDGGKSASGVAGTFKSTSGWHDGKYYALMNNVPVGTIIQINFSATGKSVYAKILGQLPDMKESAGMTVRLSNAAAAELGAPDGKFSVDVKY